MLKTMFISHIGEEAPVAAVLKDWIESAFVGEVKVFVSSDSDDITAGDRWFERIEEALAETGMLLVICSPTSVNRSWINFEAGAGWIKQVPVIPICHSGMPVNALPRPLSIFEALDACQDDFAKELIAAISKRFDFSRVPRISYEEMTAEVQAALSEILDHSGDFIKEDEMGFLDHLVATQERFEQLARIISAFGEDAGEVTIETQPFVDQMNEAQANKSEGSERRMQRIARQFGEMLETYAQKLMHLNHKYEKVLPEAERSLQYVIGFQKSETNADFEAVETMLTALDTTESSLENFKDTALTTRGILDEMPNYQRHMTRAIRSVVGEYDTLTKNLDTTLHFVRRTRARVKTMIAL